MDSRDHHPDIDRVDLDGTRMRRELAEAGLNAYVRITDPTPDVKRQPQNRAGRRALERARRKRGRS